MMSWLDHNVCAFSDVLVWPVCLCPCYVMCRFCSVVFFTVWCIGLCPASDIGFVSRSVPLLMYRFVQWACALSYV